MRHAEHPPFAAIWDGEAFRPIPAHAAAVRATHERGRRYALAEVEDERSGKSHRHYFAAVHEAWMNLPEDQSVRFPSSEHLRKWALVRAGFADLREHVAESPEAAERLAAFVTGLDEYAVTFVVGCSLQVWTAQSQSERAMGRATFQLSKDRVFGVLEAMIGSRLSREGS